MKTLKVFFFTFGIFIALAKVVYADAEINIQWEYKGLPGSIEIYEPKSDQVVMWETRSVKSKSEIPAGQIIKESKIFVSPGEKRPFVLVYHNQSNKKLKFFAAPHHASPEENAIGFKFHCLCINHVFEVGPGEYWYRVVRLDLKKDYEGKILNLKHAIVAKH